MTEIHTACPASGTFRLVEDRRTVANADVCGNCFPSLEDADEIPGEARLCRTVSRAYNTVHRVASDATRMQTHGHHDSGGGGSEAWTALTDMDPAEFDDLVGEDGADQGSECATDRAAGGNTT